MDNKYSLTYENGRWTLKKRQTGEALRVFHGTQAEATLQAVKYALEQKAREAEERPGNKKETTAPPETDSTP